MGTVMQRSGTDVKITVLMFDTLSFTLNAKGEPFWKPPHECSIKFPPMPLGRRLPSGLLHGESMAVNHKYRGTLRFVTWLKHG